MSRRKRPAKRQLVQQRAGGGLRAAVSANDRRASLASLAAESDRHLEDLIAAVKEHGADAGIAHDGDADRERQ
jgi:phosphomannomutase